MDFDANDVIYLVLASLMLTMAVMMACLGLFVTYVERKKVAPPLPPLPQPMECGRFNNEDCSEDERKKAAEIIKELDEWRGKMDGFVNEQLHLIREENRRGMAEPASQATGELSEAASVEPDRKKGPESS